MFLISVQLFGRSFMHFRILSFLGADVSDSTLLQNSYILKSFDLSFN